MNMMLSKRGRMAAAAAVLVIIGMAAEPAAAQSGDRVAASGKTSWDASLVDYRWYGNGTAANYTIRTAGELAGLANIVNGVATAPAKDSFTGKTVTLAADINLENRPWIPIGMRWGVLSSSRGVQGGGSFGGTFDGGGRSIRGLLVNNPDYNDRGSGLFGSAHTIKNLSVSGSVTGSAQVGGMAGSVGYVQNCSFEGTVAGVGVERAGSIVGVYQVGGMSVGGQWIGGLVGNLGYTMERCYFIGAVSGSSEVGGLVGSNGAAAVKDCYSIAAVTGFEQVGGITGSNTGEITRCYSGGPVTGAGQVGGIVGRMDFSEAYGRRNYRQGSSVSYCAAIGASLTRVNGAAAADAIASRIVSTWESIYTLDAVTNYARSDMKVTGENLTQSVVLNHTTARGKDVSPEDVGNENWWRDTLKWDFARVWQWNSGKNRPALRGVPGNQSSPAEPAPPPAPAPATRPAGGKTVTPKKR